MNRRIVNHIVMIIIMIVSNTIIDCCCFCDNGKCECVYSKNHWTEICVGSLALPALVVGCVGGWLVVLVVVVAIDVVAVTIVSIVNLLVAHAPHARTARCRLGFIQFNGSCQCEKWHFPI